MCNNIERLKIEDRWINYQDYLDVIVTSKIINSDRIVLRVCSKVCITN